MTTPKKLSFKQLKFNLLLKYYRFKYGSDAYFPRDVQRKLNTLALQLKDCD